MWIGKKGENGRKEEKELTFDVAMIKRRPGLWLDFV